MDNSQYQFPASELAVTPELIQDIESVFDTPEIQELLSAFDTVKAIENSIESYHAAATEKNLPPKNRVDRAREAVSHLFLVGGSQMTLEAKLLEVERTIGGNTLPKQPGALSQGFWYQQGDWFYQVQDSVGPMVARYQFVNGSVAKLVDGKLVRLADGEVESLYQIIPRYHDAISELYISKDEFGLAA